VDVLTSVIVNRLVRRNKRQRQRLQCRWLMQEQRVRVPLVPARMVG